MSNKKNTKPTGIDDIDFSQLLDLRVDYAFKLFFGTRGTRRLKSLLNAIFENKGIPRVVSSLTIANPSLEKKAPEDKASVLDIRATLADGTPVCIEMHLYDLNALKYKSLRTWARAYGEDLEPGQKYPEQNIVVCISFLNGPVKDSSGKPVDRIHSLFQVIERDGRELLLPDMELHYIDMIAFVEYCKNLDAAKTDHDIFTQWLTLITQKDIEDKERVKQICSNKEVKAAVKTLSNMSESKINRQAYQRRLDEIYYNEKMVREHELYYTTATEQSATIAEQSATIAEQSAALADKDAVIADKDAVLAEQAEEIARLKAQLGEGKKTSP